MTLFVGLDLGTAGGRCFVFDETGREVASASRPWRYRQEGGPLRELDPDAAYAGLAAATAEAMAGLDSGRVAGVGVTSQRTGAVLLDEAGVELYTGPNIDGRGGPSGLALERDHGEVVYRVAGRLPVMIYLPARLGWFRENDPDVLRRARWALSLSDWLAFRLTGAAGTEPTQAAEMLLYDVAAGEWSADLCARLGVDPALLPPVSPAGSRLGGVTPGAAADFGLEPGVSVTAAGADTQCAAVGMGVVEPGQAIAVAGSTMICEQVTGRPLPDPERRLWTSPHAFPARFVLEAHCGESGIPIDWVATIMGVDHAWLDEAAAKAPPGAQGMCFLDSMPSRASDFTLVRTGGLSFPVPLLALAGSREDVARATLEGVAFAASAGLEWIWSVAGAPREVVAAGGVARLGTFVRILAAALGRPVRASPRPNASALGAALLAAAGAGRFPDVASAVEAMADRGGIVEPDPEWIEPSAAAYATWRERVARVEETAFHVRSLTT